MNRSEQLEKQKEVDRIIKSMTSDVKLKPENVVANDITQLSISVCGTSETIVLSVDKYDAMCAVVYAAKNLFLKLPLELRGTLLKYTNPLLSGLDKLERLDEE